MTTRLTTDPTLPLPPTPTPAPAPAPTPAPTPHLTSTPTPAPTPPLTSTPGLTTGAEGVVLREAVGRVVDELGVRSVADLRDTGRLARLERAVAAAGWRELLSDAGTATEVALVAEEFGRGLVDVPYLGPVLADDLRRQIGGTGTMTVSVDGVVLDCRGLRKALSLIGDLVLAGEVGPALPGADLTRVDAELLGPLEVAGQLRGDHPDRWVALALVLTTADLVGVARGAAGKESESAALIEGSTSLLRFAARAVDEVSAFAALRAARIAKLYAAQAARTICESAVRRDGRAGLALVYLRRALTSIATFPVHLDEIDCSAPTGPGLVRELCRRGRPTRELAWAVVQSELLHRHGRGNPLLTAWAEEAVGHAALALGGPRDETLLNAYLTRIRGV